MPTNSSHPVTNRKIRVVHSPAIETRTVAYLAQELPYRMAAIRDQLNQQYTSLGQATSDALRLRQPQHAHQIVDDYGPAYLAGVAANAALVARTLHLSARELVYQCTMAGFDTSSLAECCADIEATAAQVETSYSTFLSAWNAPQPQPQPQPAPV